VFAISNARPTEWSRLAMRWRPRADRAGGVRGGAGRGRPQSVEDLVSFIARHIVALVPAEATTLAEQAAAVEAEPVPALLAALVAGGDPAMILRALATAQRESPRAAATSSRRRCCWRRIAR
jgi:hypothetical protein